MIVFSAIVPHSPLLLPTLGKDQQKKLNKTLAAYRVLAADLNDANPDAIFVITPHGVIIPEAFSLSISKTYRVDLKEFGDFLTTAEFRGDLQLTEKIRQLKLGDNGIPLVGTTDDILDYGTAIPLLTLGVQIKPRPIIPLRVSMRDATAHFKVGQALAEILGNSPKRIAVLASADLAQTLTDASPGGFAPAGKKFDTALVRALRKGESQKILALWDQMEEAKACGLRPIVLLLGILHDLCSAPEVLAYEGPFGVGYLTARFNAR